MRSGSCASWDWPCRLLGARLNRISGDRCPRRKAAALAAGDGPVLLARCGTDYRVPAPGQLPAAAAGTLEMGAAPVAATRSRCSSSLRTRLFFRLPRRAIRPHRLLAGNARHIRCAGSKGVPCQRGPPPACRSTFTRALGLSGGHGSYSPRPGVPGRGEKNAAPRLSTKRPRPAGGGYAASQGRSRTNRVKPLLCRFRPRRNIIPSPARCSGRPGSGLGSAKQHASR